mmetsp:Transcript_43164/g.119380  ORF Transcript_43164/g.119380 Transcript_43164/m.119380 type:complete len:444 (+) Transcript_43164:230-1561(+)
MATTVMVDNLDTGSSFQAGGTLGSPSSPKTSPFMMPTASLPRYGKKGGGSIQMHNKEVLEAIKEDMLNFAEKAKELKSSEGRRPSTVPGPKAERSAAPSSAKSSIKSETMRSSSGAIRASGDSPGSANRAEKNDTKQTQEERKRKEIHSKWEKTEALRALDRKEVLERVERGRERREERYQRLYAEITSRDNLAYKTASTQREREVHQEKRRRELHAAWDEIVYQPLAEQLEQHMNPPNRAYQQRLTGSKSVEFKMPNQVFQLVANVVEDPARKPVVNLAREAAFHQVATSVLQGCYSAPDLHHGMRAASSGSVVPRATSRPVMEPTMWSQKDIQGTMFGHFGQVAEYGPGFRRSIRGGTNVHIPDCQDNALAAGSRKHRTIGHGDVGILRGDTATRGEASHYKSSHGASSAAPLQDHFTYETGTTVTNLEFPLGKKMFPEYH